MEEYRKSFVETSKKFFKELRHDSDSLKKTMKELGFDLSFNICHKNGTVITTAVFTKEANSFDPQRVTICDIDDTPKLNQNDVPEIVTTIVITDAFSYKVDDTPNDDMMPIFNLMKDAIRINFINLSENR